jgi:hypothetical protein
MMTVPPRDIIHIPIILDEMLRVFSYAKHLGPTVEIGSIHKVAVGHIAAIYGRQIASGDNEQDGYRLELERDLILDAVWLFYLFCWAPLSDIPMGSAKALKNSLYFVMPGTDCSN